MTTASRSRPPSASLDPIVDAAGFRPARFLMNGHAQTIWPHLFRRVSPVPGEREIWELPGQEVLDAFLLPCKPGRPGVIVLHGLEARAESSYMRGFMHAIDAAGWNGIALEFPSCGPSATRQSGLYHAGKTDALAAVVDRARARWQTRSIGAIGISLGGNVLLKFLGETAASAPLRAAVAISVPFDLSVCAARLDAGGFFAWMYRERFLRSLRRKARQLTLRQATPFTARAVDRIHSFAAFDEQVTAPLFGFAGASDYWRRNSCAGFLPSIRRPTLLVSARDDPFVGASCLPIDAVTQNPSLALWLSDHGGHVGFVGGSLLRPVFLAEGLATNFLRNHLP